MEVEDKRPHATRQTVYSFPEQKKKKAGCRETSTSATLKATRLRKSISTEAVATQFAVI